MLTRCPKCGISWKDSRETPTVLFEDTNHYKTIEDAQEAAKNYGWTPDNHLKPAINVTGIEYSHRHPYHYDGVSEWVCLMCRTRVGRWSGKILGEEEYDAPH